MNTKLQAIKSMIWENISFKKEDSLSKDFNLYLKENKGLALSMMDNGYVPSIRQLNQLNENLALEAQSNINFFFHYSRHLSKLPDNAFCQFVSHHNLREKCKNEKMLFQNMDFWFEEIRTRDGLGQKIQKSLVLYTNQYGAQASQFKPRYANIHAFEFNQNEKNIYDKFIYCMGNSLILLPEILHDIKDFIEVRNSIHDNIKNIYDLIQKHNVRIEVDSKKTLHYHKENCRFFRVEALEYLRNSINSYNTEELENKVIKKTKELIGFQKDDCEDVTQELKKYKFNLNKSTVGIINNIIGHYDQIHGSYHDVGQQHEVQSLYKDAMNVVKNYLSIDENMRQSLADANGKKPLEIMESSLQAIENKFYSYIEEINQQRLMNLSVEEKKIKMKI